MGSNIPKQYVISPQLELILKAANILVISTNDIMILAAILILFVNACKSKWILFIR